jgi:hypothetical protein
MNLIIIFLAFSLIAILILSILAFNAPLGSEDSNGFYKL